MRCEGIIPEQIVPVGSEMVNVAGEGEPERFERRILTETRSEHPCPAKATMLARSMRETDDGTWQKDGPDRAYCAVCFEPGRMAHRDDTTTAHPAMSVDEYDA